MDFKVLKAENGYILKTVKDPLKKRGMFDGAPEMKSLVATNEKDLVDLFLEVVRTIK